MGGRAGITLRQPKRFRLTGSFARKPVLALQEAYITNNYREKWASRTREAHFIC